MRIAIIGSGGAGMTSAWLLDERHEVTVFERNAQLGGHAHTTMVEHEGRLYPADDGFSWFSDALYPHFLRLLEVNGIATRIVRLSATFTDRRRARTLVLPPTGIGPFLRTVASPSTIASLLKLNRAISLAGPMVQQHQHDLSWGDFLQKHRISGAFERELLTPFVAGAWGGPYERMKDFSAYTLMKYFVFHRPSGLSRYPWHVVRDGAASYVEQVARGLTRTTILRNTTISGLERTAGGGWIVVDSTGTKRVFDRVIVATGAKDARVILRDVRDLDETRRILDGFEYYRVRLATHQDPSFLPPRRSDWRTANVVWEGARSGLHIWTGQEHGAPVFTGYLGEREPERCLHVSTFHLPLITPAHYRAQQKLWEHQGTNGLYFSGDWTRDIGCHEDAVTSAMLVCEALDADLPRLALLRGPRAHPPMLPLPSAPPAPQLAA